MLRFSEVLIVSVALCGANFAYQAMGSELWSVAADRSYYQVGAIFALFLSHRLELGWRS